MNTSNSDMSTNQDMSGNQNIYNNTMQQPFFFANNKTKKISIGMIILYIFIYIICAMLIPSCILFFITKWSAKSALKSTVCGNPELLKSLLQVST
jgi:hypothetical protein